MFAINHPFTINSVIKLSKENKCIINFQCITSFLKGVHCKKGSQEEENIKHFKVKNPSIKIVLFNDVILGKEKLDLIVESGQSYDGILIEKIKAKHPKTKFVKHLATLTST